MESISLQSVVEFWLSIFPLGFLQLFAWLAGLLDGLLQALGVEARVFVL